MADSAAAVREASLDIRPLHVQDVLESVTFSFEGGPNLNFAEGTFCHTCLVLLAVLDLLLTNQC